MIKEGGRFLTQPIEVTKRLRLEGDQHLISVITAQLDRASLRLQSTTGTEEGERLKTALKKNGLTLFGFVGLNQNEFNCVIRPLGQTPYETPGNWLNEEVDVQLNIHGFSPSFGYDNSKAIRARLKRPERVFDQVSFVDETGVINPIADHVGQATKIIHCLERDVCIWDEDIECGVANLRPELVTNFLDVQKLKKTLALLIEPEEVAKLNPEQAANTVINPCMKALKKFSTYAPNSSFLIAREIVKKYVGDKTGENLLNDPWFKAFKDTLPKEMLFALFPDQLLRLPEGIDEGEIETMAMFTCQGCGNQLGLDTVEIVTSDIPGVALLNVKRGCPTCGMRAVNSHFKKISNRIHVDDNDSFFSIPGLHSPTRRLW